MKKTSGMGETTKPKTSKKKITVVSPQIDLQEIQKPFNMMIEYINTSMISHTNVYTNLMETNAELNKRVAELQKTNGLEEQIQELTNANLTLSKQVEDTVEIANRQIEELERDLDKANKEIAEQRKELDILREELQREKATHHALQKDFEAQLRNKTLIGGMDRENKKLRDDIAVLQLQMEGLRLQRDAAKAEATEWRRRAEEAEAQLALVKVDEKKKEIYEFEYRGTTYYCDDSDIVYSDEDGTNRIGCLINGTQMSFDKEAK